MVGARPALKFSNVRGPITGMTSLDITQGEGYACGLTILLIRNRQNGVDDRVGMIGLLDARLDLRRIA
jgi:hypothetical protein